MQEDKHGQKKIIAVASHTFNATERNWSTTEREAYAIKWAITKFDYFLRCRPFVVLTDHRSLTYLDQREFNNAKIRRWLEEISCYKFVLEYVEGESNVWADMLSRRYGHSKDKLTADPTPAGKGFKLQGSSLNIYVIVSIRSLFCNHTHFSPTTFISQISTGSTQNITKLILKLQII